MGHWRALAYGALGLPLAFAALPLYVHLPRFYADATGLPLAWLGAILLAARLLDALADPWLGWLADRWHHRRLLALALAPFLAGFIALFNPPPGAAAGWLLGALALTCLGFSAASVAYQAWGAAAPEAALRTSRSAAREAFGLAGVLLAAALPGWLAADLHAGTQRLAWVLPPLLLVAAVLAFAFGGREAGAPAAPMAPGASLRRACGDPGLRRLLAVFVANGIASALPATLFLFYVADVLDAAAASGKLLAWYFACGASSVPAWLWLARRCGRVRAWAGSMLLAMAAFGATNWLGRGDLAAFTLVCAASGLALGADLALPAAIAADLAHRRGQAGMVFGVWNFVAKFNLAATAGLALPLLAALGYRPGTTAGLDALSHAYALLPLGFKLLAAALLWRWRDSLEESP